MKKRTKQQKMRTQQRRAEQVSQVGHEFTFSSSVGSEKKSKVVAAPRAIQASDLFHYDLRLIRKDLLKTVAVTVVVLSVLAGLKIWVIR